MSTLEFRSLVLAVIAGALVIATALLGWMAYDTVYARILAGFDRKLLGISGTVGALTDGDAHAAYQRPFVLEAFTAGPAGSAWAWDRTRAALVRVDLASAAALEEQVWPEPPQALVWLDAGERLLVQRADGALVDRQNPTEVLTTAVEPGHWLSDGTQLYRWDGVTLRRWAMPPSAEPATAADGVTEAPADASVDLTPPRPLRLLARDRSAGHWVGFDPEARQLIAFDDTGRLLREAAVDPGEREVVGLAADGTAVHLAADELLRYDWQAQTLSEDQEPGYFDTTDPFYAAHVPMYRRLRERVGLTFLYTEVYIGGDQIRYVLDGSTGDSHSLPGYLDSVPEADIDAVVRAQVEGTPFVSGIRQWEAWGLVKVSAAPIRNRAGKVVALAGADVDIGVIRSKTRNALFAVLGVGALLLLLSGLVSLWVAQSITRPLRDIKNAALRIAAGQYGARLESTSADEIGRLAGSLDRLSLRLREHVEASSASQSALVSGRLDEALRAMLEQDAAHPYRLELPTSDGRLLLLWAEPAAAGDSGDLALRRGQLRVLAERMIAAGAANPEVLLEADPALSLVLAWTAAERRVHWCGRDRRLIALRADGARGRVASGSVVVPPDTLIHLDTGEVLVERGPLS